MKAAISWVDALLSRWGRWSIRCESGALGFASSCMFFGAGNGDSFDSALPYGVMDEDMEAVDGAIRRLSMQGGVPSIQHMAVIQVYKFGSGRSDEDNAVALGVSRKSLTQYIHQAQRKIALDISVQCPQNQHQSVIGEIAPKRNQPVLAHA